MSGLRHGRLWDAGFTVVEIVFSSAILLIVSVGVMGALTFATSATANTQVRDRAVEIANQKLEYARNLPYDSVGVYYSSGIHGDPDGTILTPQSVNASGPVSVYTVDTSVTWVRDANKRAKYKNITVKVSWSTLLRTGSVTLSTSIYGRSQLVNTGDYLLHFFDKDTGVGIPGGSVTIDPYGSANPPRTASTDASGEAFFGYVPIGALVVGVVSPQSGGQATYLVDASSLATANIAADKITEQYCPAQKPSQAVVTVLHKADNDPIPNATVTISRQGGSETIPAGTTSASGVASFNGLWAGTYNVYVTAPGGYTATSGTLTITQGNSTGSATIKMPGPATLTVLSQEPTSGPIIAGATINLWGPNTTATVAPGSPKTTSTTGTATFTGLTAGRYYIGSTALGHNPSILTYVDLTADNASSATTTMSLAPGYLIVTVQTKVGGVWTAYSGERLQIYSADGTYNYNNFTTNSSGQVSLPASSGYTTALKPLQNYTVQPMSPKTGTAQTVYVNGGLPAQTLTLQLN